MSYLLALTLLLCGGTTALMGQDLMEMSLEELMNMEVESTTKTKVNIRKAPGTVYSFSQVDFENFGLKSIDDLYWYIPGLQPYSYKKNNVIILRGVIERFNNRTQHIVDGVVARNGYYNHEEFDDFIPLEWINSFEMIIGPGSALYGANAFSGVSSLNLKDFSETREIKLNVTSEIDPLSPQFTGTYRDKNIVVGLTGLTGESSTPQYNITGESFNQTKEHQMYHGFMKYNLMGKGRVFARYGKQTKPYINNKDGKKVLLEKSPIVVGVDLNHGDSEQQGLFGMKANHTVQSNAEVNDEDGSKETQNVSFTNLELTYNKSTAKVNYLFGASYLLEKADDLKLDDGTEMLQEPDVSTNNIAGFGQSIINISDPLTLTLGVRYDIFNEFDNKLNGRAAFVYDLSESSTVKLLGGTAVRTPSLREWNKDLEDTSFEQPQLEPEELTTFELSYNRILGNFYFDATLFNNGFKKMLLEQDTPVTDDDPEGGSDEYFYNTDDAVSMTGAELNAKYQLDKLHVIGGFSTLITDNGEGNEISYIRGYKYSLSVLYNYLSSHKAVVSFTGFDKPGMFDEKNDKYMPTGEAANYDEPTAFLYINVALSGQVTDNIAYSVGLRNLTDSKVYDPYYLSSKYRNIERQDRKMWFALSYDLNL